MAFAGCSSISEITIPESVNEIGQQAFIDCTGITNITIPGSVDFLFETFCGCTNLENVVISQGVTAIYSCSFEDCTSLISITIPDSVTRIDWRAFMNCTSLTSVKIPESVSVISSDAFKNCSSLSSVVIGKEIYSESAFPDLSSDIFHFYYDIEYINDGHGTVSGKTRTYGTDVVELTITPDRYYVIDKVMWNDGSDTVELIPGSYGKYTMPDSDNNVTISVSFRCTHTVVADPAIEPDCTHTGLTAGSHCSNCGEIIVAQEEVPTTDHTPVVDEAVAPDLTHTGLTEGSHCSVCGEVLVAQEEIPATGHYGTCGDNLTWTLDDEGTLTISGTGDMYYKSWAINDWSIDGNYVDIIPWAKFRSEIVSIIIEDGVTSIRGFAFIHCDELVSISIPESVTTIEHFAFYGCESLSSIEIPDSVTSIGAHAFSNCTSLESIEIPYSVTSIENGTFYKCISLTSIEIPDSVTSIGDAFGYCTSLTYFFIPDNVTSISDFTFARCTSLSRIEIPDSVTSIGEYAFLGCTSLESIKIPYSVTSIGVCAFAECPVLSSVILNKDAYNEDAFTDLSSDIFHFYYDVEYVNDGHGTIIGKTRTFGTDIVELTVTPDNNYVIDKVTWTDGNRSVELSADSNGKYTMPDSDCDVTISFSFKCLHKPVTDDSVEPDCTHMGLTEGSHCSVCGEVFVAQEEVPAKGHTPVTDEAVDPDCTHTGLTEGSHCSVCSEVIVAQEEVPANGHTPVTDKAVDPDCTNTGLTEGSHCSVCGEVLVEQEEVPAKGHTPVTDEAVAPDCTHTGLTEGSHCSVCGEVLVEQRELPAIPSVSITKQPVDFTGLSGSTATFSVEAEGTGLKYQWQTNSSGTWTNSTLSGATTATLTVEITDTSDGNKFRCVVLDSYYNFEVSDEVTLHTASPVSITKQPEDYTGIIGNTATFGVEADGVGLMYKWQSFNSGKWSDITSTGATTSALTVDITDSSDGNKYRCIVIDSNYNLDISTEAILHIADPVIITDQPADYTGRAGSKVTFGVTAQGEGLTYQWQNCVNGVWRNSGATGSKTSKITFNVTNSHNGMEYRCVIIDGYGQTITSEVASLSVVAPLTITEQPENYTGTAGSKATFRVTAQGEGLTYQWQVSTNGSWSNSGASGSKTSKITFNVTNNHNGKQYRCIVTDSNGQTVTSDPATVVIATPLAITKQPEDYTGIAGSKATFSVTAQGDGLTYQWQNFVNGVWRNSGASGSKTSAISFNVTNSHNGMEYRCVITDGYGQKIISEVASVSVVASLTITEQPEDYTGTAGSKATFSVTAQGEGLTYQWQMYSNGEWRNSGATGSKTSNITFNVTYNHNGMEYRCVITDCYGQKVTSDTATVHVGIPACNYMETEDVPATVDDPEASVTIDRVEPEDEEDQDQITVIELPTDRVEEEPDDNGADELLADYYDINNKEQSDEKTISKELKVTLQPANGKDKAGNKVIVSVEAEGQGLRYQWQYFKNDEWIDLDMEGADSADLILDMTEAGNGMQYRCIVTDFLLNEAVTDIIEIN
ncbi:MAG: leucine-rich repeat domain-containing protein [Clostridiales bacterium]|nr:leucine-rich repeat domain-containing protein [Clostridiales bacterium]